MNQTSLFAACLPHHLEVLRRNLEVLQRMSDGIDEVQADRAPFAGGSTFRWLLGHVLVYRDRMLTLAGGEPVWEEDGAAAFERGSDPGQPGARAPSLSALHALLQQQQARLEAALSGLDGDALADTGPRGTLGEDLAFRLWHDTYHAGQAVLHRRAVGLPSPIG